MLNEETGSDFSGYENEKTQLIKKNNNLSKYEKLSLYSLNILTYFTFASTTGSGVALPEFSKNLNASISQLSLGISFQAIFGCIGNIIATYTLDKWNRQLQFSAVVLWLGLCNFLIPFCANLNIYYIVLIFCSLAAPVVTAVPNVWVMELFEKNSSFYFQTLHLFFSLGTILSPIIIAPFLSEDTILISNNLNETLSTEANNIDNEFNEKSFKYFKMYKNSKIWIPYIIFGSLLIVNSICLFVAYLIKPYKKPNNTEKCENKENNFEYQEFNTKKNISKNYKIFFLSSVALLIALQTGSELNSGNFLPSYLLKSSLGLNPEKVAYMTTILSSFTALGRFLASFLTLKIKIEQLICFNFILVFIGNILLITLGVKIITVTWISLALIGLGYSSTIPLIYCFIEKNIPLTNKISTIMGFSSSFYLACSPSLIGYFLDSNPSYFIIFNLIVVVLMFIIFLTLNLVSFIRKKKF